MSVSLPPFPAMTLRWPTAAATSADRRSRGDAAQGLARGSAQENQGPAESRTGADRQGATGLAAASTAEAGGAEALQALGTLRRIARSTRRTASEAAREKLRRLLDQIKQLRQFGIDPKVVARQAAQLAKQIAAAAREFAASAERSSAASSQVSLELSASVPTAGVPAAGGAMTDTAAATADAATTETPADASQPADSAAAADGDPRPATSAATSETDAATAKSTTGPGAGATGTEATGPGAGERDTAGSRTGALPQAEIDRLLARGAAADERNKEIAEDRRLFGEVKRALTTLKALIERARHASPQNPHPLTAEEAAPLARAVERAVRDVENAIATIGQHGEGDPGAGAGEPGSVSAAPSPAIDIVV